MRSLTFSYVHLLVLISFAYAEPEALTTYFKTGGDYVRAEYGVVQPPKEIEPYMIKMRRGISKHADWFKAYSQTATTGAPLPYHEKLGVTEDEYSNYLGLWDKREFKKLKQVDLKLEKRADGTWMIRATGPGFPIQALKFSADFSSVISPNGRLERSEDVKSNKASLLGEWTGAQWVLESSEAISKTIENVAIGKKANQVTGYLLYRLQEISSTGRKLYDNQILIQFPLKK